MPALHAAPPSPNTLAIVGTRPAPPREHVPHHPSSGLLTIRVGFAAGTTRDLVGSARYDSARGGSRAPTQNTALDGTAASGSGGGDLGLSVTRFEPSADGDYRVRAPGQTDRGKTGHKCHSNVVRAIIDS